MKSGFTFSLGHFLMLGLAGLLAVMFIYVAGWAVAFGFAQHVVVPYIHPPVAWANAVTLLLSLMFTGVGAVVIVGVLALLGFGILALFSGMKAKS